jgi:mono/diheme cytochrome c family protein
MNHRTRRLAFLPLLLTPLLGFAFGGWAVVTVDDVPTHLVSGKRTPLVFTVRQHGVTLMNGLSPSVEMRSGSAEVVTVQATSTGEQGRYQAAITPPSPGVWTVIVKSGFGNSQTTLLPLRAIASNAPTPRAIADADRGRELFYGKGCTTCHVRGGDGNEQFQVGPVLTGRRYAVEVVSKFLDDPDKSPLSQGRKEFTRMPKLGLSAREIAALVAFLNTAEVASR